MAGAVFGAGLFWLGLVIHFVIGVCWFLGVMVVGGVVWECRWLLVARVALVDGDWV